MLISISAVIAYALFVWERLEEFDPSLAESSLPFAKLSYLVCWQKNYHHHAEGNSALIV